MVFLLQKYISFKLLTLIFNFIRIINVYKLGFEKCKIRKKISSETALKMLDFEF